MLLKIGELHDPSYLPADNDVVANLGDIKEDNSFMMMQRVHNKGNIYNQLIPPVVINKL